MFFLIFKLLSPIVQSYMKVMNSAIIYENDGLFFGIYVNNYARMAACMNLSLSIALAFDGVIGGYEFWPLEQSIRCRCIIKKYLYLYLNMIYGVMVQSLLHMMAYT